jgi:hypothetical protein
MEQRLLHDARKHEDPAGSHRRLAAGLQIRIRPLRDDAGEMPNHVECCTYPVLEWIAERVPSAPVNVMAQFRPDKFCNPHTELSDSWRHARELRLHFEATTFERSHPFGTGANGRCV